MTPAEKWERINNPQTVEDYSICMNREELMLIEAGRKIVAQLDTIEAERQELKRRVKALAKDAASRLDALALEVLARNRV